MKELRGVIYRMFEAPAGSTLFVRWSSITTVKDFNRERFWDRLENHLDRDLIFNLLHTSEVAQKNGYYDLIFCNPDRTVAIFIPEGKDRTAIATTLIERFGAETELLEEPIHYMLSTEKILALEALADHPNPA